MSKYGQVITDRLKIMIEEGFRRWVAIATVVALLAACAAHSGQFGPRDARDVISADEVNYHSFSTAYEAVRKLRAWWLGRTSEAEYGPAIFLDDRRMGGYFALRRIAFDDVREFRFFSTDHAVAKWGPELAQRSGVIQVISRRE
jgi:hypothetical protein